MQINLFSFTGDIGQIAKILKSKYGNTLVVIEELDKCIGITSGQKRTSPLVPLLDLLQHSSATQFSEEALDLKLDSSFLSYIVTSNTKDIPLPLLSRMMVYKLEQPTEEQIKLQICDSIWTDILEEEAWGHAFSPNLPIDLKDKISSQSPRQIKLLLKLGASYSAQKNQSSKEKIKLISQDIKIKKEQKNIYGLYLIISFTLKNGF